MTEEFAKDVQEAYDNLLSKHTALLKLCKKFAAVADEARKHLETCKDIGDKFIPCPDNKPGCLVLHMGPHPLKKALTELEGG